MYAWGAFWTFLPSVCRVTVNVKGSLGHEQNIPPAGVSNWAQILLVEGPFSYLS